MREVSVSILCDEKKEKVIEKINKSNADYIHLDIMDGKFVKNKFLTISELTKIIPLIQKKVDIHLMVNDPTKYIKSLVYIDISYITIHQEIKDYMKYLNLIKSYGFKAGISIKPNTPVENIFPILNDISLVLIMSVEPGESGQKFINVSEKINKLKSEIVKRKLDVKLEVDGGINYEVLEFVSNADILVSASYVLKDLNNINYLK